MTAVFRLVALCALAFGLGCDPSTSFTRSTLSGPARQQLVEGCCRCLATSSVEVAHPDHTCPDTVYPTVGGSPDAGPCPPPDAGFSDDGGVSYYCADSPIPAQLRTESRCLCDDDADSCVQRLNAAIDLVVMGACVDVAGPCEAECSGVLAFPE